MLALVLGGGAAPAWADVLISNVTLIDGTGAPPLKGASVLVEGDRIVQVSPGPIAAPEGVPRIDGTGKFLIPGLIDSHIHLQGGRVPQADGGTAVDRALALRTLQAYLYCGVTSVYDSGNNEDFIFGLRAEERDGAIVSPRIFATGSNITAPGGYGDSPFSIKVSDLSADRALLQRHFDRKPDLQKILHDHLGTNGTPLAPVMAPETLAGVIRMANENGIATTVHAGSELDSRAALDAGIDAFAHPVRAKATDAFIARLAAKRIPVATTLTVFTHIAMLADDPGFFDAPLFRATIDADQITDQQTTGRHHYIDSGMSAQFKLMVPHMADNVKRMHDAGVILALGTDRTWGASVHMELALLHKAGIPLFDLVRIATLNGAIYVHRERDLGSIERGKLADMVLLDADPTADVRNFQAIDAVFKGGRQIDRSTLDVPINQKKK